MEFHPTELPGVVVVEPKVFRDARGFFLESFHAARFAAAGIAGPFVQDNHSSSRARTLRGLHLQVAHAQGKLVRCTEGEVWDVAVDVRRGSPTFGAWVGRTLSAENFLQLWVPPGFAHGFCVLSDSAQIEYKVTDSYHPEDEIGIRWDDPDLAIDWPVDDPILSPKDAAAPSSAELGERLPIYRSAG